ncbi:MAG: hypothetical protein V3V01_02785 [Acidimicrobiales bacterium]
MYPASAEGRNDDKNRALKRYGPIALIAVVVLAVVGLVVAGGGDDELATNGSAVADTGSAGDTTPATGPPNDGTQPPDGGTTAPDSTDPPATEDPLPADSPLPDGVMSFGVASDLGLNIDFGDRCDPDTGRVKVPDFFAPECYAPFDGDNGGATARGVTEDSIRIVWWVSQDSDPILDFITSAISNDDTNADDEATMRGLIELYETYYETYGRKIDLVVMVGSGAINDEAAARADAVKIDEELDPFMVWGGPLLTNAFAEELSARGIPCFGCGPGQTSEYYQERAGLAYAITKGPEQLDLMVAEYIGKRLAGDPAIHAGDESMHPQERVFGRIWLESSAASVESNARFETALEEFGVSIAESQSYALNPATLQEAAATVIARMKDAGVTSVIFNGDPIAPREFTNEATAQNYFPEWIVTGSVLIDTTAFSRTYNQEQWAHAFGISNQAARVDRQVAGSFSKYEWFHGEPPAADGNIGVINPTVQTFFSFLQGTGPNLTIETFNDATFLAPPTRSALTAASLSWGSQGIWPDNLEPDYRGVDDISELWWDAEATGLDEIDKDGTGLWRFVNGGQRYKPGEIPEGPPQAFDSESTVTIYDERPATEAVPDYDPLPTQ